MSCRCAPEQGSGKWGALRRAVLVALPYDHHRSGCPRRRPAARRQPMTAGHSPLTAAEVIAKGGWHPRYARVIALASDDGYGFALVDGNGDGSELEAEAWAWRDGAWQGSGSSGAGRLDRVGPVRTGGQIGESVWFAYGSAPGRDTVTIAFDGKLRPVPVGEHGVWAFIAVLPNRAGRDAPVLAE
jgi:hypothetical protein